MEGNKIAEWIWANKKDIGIFLGTVWGLFRGGMWIYKKTYPLIVSFKKASYAIEEIPKISKKVDVVSNRQTALIELNDAAFFENDSTGRCIRANAALCSLFGVTQNKMLGYGWLNYIKNSDQEREAFEQAIETDNEITRDYIILYGDKHDKEIPATYIAHIKRDENGNVINVTGKVFLRN